MFSLRVLRTVSCLLVMGVVAWSTTGCGPGAASASKNPLQSADAAEQLEGIKARLQSFINSGMLGSGVSSLQEVVNQLKSSNPELHAKIAEDVATLSSLRTSDEIRAKCKAIVEKLP